MHVTRRAVKKALAIVLVVALYSWLETVFLFSILTPYLFGFRYDVYQAFVGWSQFIVIPGFAALFSRLMYGTQGWKKRAAEIVLAGALGVPLLMTLVISSVAAIAWAASKNPILGVISFLVFACGIVRGAVWIAGRMNRRTVAIEGARWLKERQLLPVDRKRRSQGIRFALWIPLLTVLLVGTFLLQIWGVFSHAIQPDSGNLGRFQVPVPVTSVVFYRDRDATTGNARASFMSGHGSPLLGIFYPSHGLRLSEWGFRTTATRDPNNVAHVPTYDEPTGRRSFLIGDENIECLEYSRSYLRQHYPGERKPPDYSSIVFVNCGGPGRFTASFGGEKSDLPAFYRMLAGTKELQ